MCGRVPKVIGWASLVLALAACGPATATAGHAAGGAAGTAAGGTSGTASRVASSAPALRWL